MYVVQCVCMYLRTDACPAVCLDDWMTVGTYVWLEVCMSVCMYVCLAVRAYHSTERSGSLAAFTTACVHACMAVGLPICMALCRYVWARLGVLVCICLNGYRAARLTACIGSCVLGVRACVVCDVHACVRVCVCV